MRFADSMLLLVEAGRRVREAGHQIGNIDSTVIAQAPKLAPHLEAMCANLVKALEPVREPMGHGVHVSITPKRGEGIGFVGRTEGVAAWAVALLELG